MAKNVQLFAADACILLVPFALAALLVAPLPLLQTMAAQNGTNLRKERMATEPKPNNREPPNNSRIGFGAAPALASFLR